VKIVQAMNCLLLPAVNRFSIRLPLLPKINTVYVLHMSDYNKHILSVYHTIHNEPAYVALICTTWESAFLLHTFIVV
jgi:hypothetical protein